MSAIEKHGHGGDILTAQALFGVTKDQLLDFSANINPFGPPERVMNVLRENLYSIVHYPDPIHRRLSEKLVERVGISRNQLVIGNGAAECMALILLAFQPKVVGIVYPSFSEYTTLSISFGASVESCFGRYENNFKPKMADLFKLMDKVDLVFIGQPNNPTGILYTKDELREISIYAKKTNTFVVIDEAFIDFVPFHEKYTLLDEINDYPTIIIIRSMTKFYAIPGLRLGYAICSQDFAIELKRKQVPWSVNSLALLAGEACLEETEYEKKTIRSIQEERAYLIKRIQNGLNWIVFPGEVNFLLIRLPVHLKANDLQLKVGQHGIMIRSCSMYPGLTEQDFRIAVRTRKENNELLAVLKKVVKNRRDLE